MNSRIPFFFILFALLSLILSGFVGILLGFQNAFPDFIKDIIAFNKLRPLHVSSSVGWIILSVTGGIYYYLMNTLKLEIYSKNLLKTHFYIFLIVSIALIYSLLSGNVGGREYLSFSPYLMIPILIAWILFAFNFIKTTSSQIKTYPVYIWMWTTGIIFMIYHLAESNFWLISSVRQDYIKDFTIQWKSYGSFVGAWNLLVYGTAIFLMAKVKNDDSYARSKTAFFFYFLGLVNLMLGWAHHTYIVPTEPWIRYLAYGTSMTEWIIIIKMIHDWKRNLSQEDKTENCLTYRYLMSMEFWVFINLLLALLISIPYLNLYTHGTHITVAHSMGTTIGINSTILLASVFYILKREFGGDIAKKYPILRFSIKLFNISLAGFFISLLLLGLHRSDWMINNYNSIPFGEMFEQSKIYIYPFIASGFGLFISFLITAGIAFKCYIKILNVSGQSKSTNTETF